MRGRSCRDTWALYELAGNLKLLHMRQSCQCLHCRDR